MTYLHDSYLDLPHLFTFENSTFATPWRTKPTESFRHLRHSSGADRISRESRRSEIDGMRPDTTPGVATSCSFLADAGVVPATLVRTWRHWGA